MTALLWTVRRCGEMGREGAAAAPDGGGGLRTEGEVAGSGRRHCLECAAAGTCEAGGGGGRGPPDGAPPLATSSTSCGVLRREREERNREKRNIASVTRGRGSNAGLGRRRRTVPNA